MDLSGRLIWAGTALIAFSAAAIPLRAVAAPPDAPGLHDLVVIPPDAHERKFPAVRLEGLGGMEDSATIQIPETLHVHRYYYSGDKEIQGPILHGGPTMIVANHPVCGERMYVRATLPAGAPRIAYTGRSITYVYPDRRVEVRFHRFGKDKVSIHFVSGQGIARRTRQAARRVHEGTVEAWRHSPLAQSLSDAAVAGGQTVQGAGTAAQDMMAGAIDGGRRLIGAIPGITPLQSLGEQSAEQRNAAAIRQQQRVLDREEVPFVPTNRN